jgi:hypothetical protein
LTTVTDGRVRLVDDGRGGLRAVARTASAGSEDVDEAPTSPSCSRFAKRDTDVGVSRSERLLGVTCSGSYCCGSSCQGGGTSYSAGGTVRSWRCPHRLRVADRTEAGGVSSFSSPQAAKEEDEEEEEGDGDDDGWCDDLGKVVTATVRGTTG